MAIEIDRMLAEGKQVYNMSIDPEKRGIITDVNLPPEYKTPRRIPTNTQKGNDDE